MTSVAPGGEGEAEKEGGREAVAEGEGDSEKATGLLKYA